MDGIKQETGRLVKGGGEGVSLLRICKAYGIPVLASPPRVLKQLGIGANAGGAAVNFGGKYYILCEKTLPRKTLRFIIAHELGHILLGHLLCWKDGRSSAHIEAEADAFASAVTALWEKGGSLWTA